jgi:glyoxylase-like metal-dependent hydrolase (beta-lactamase superfamily II)
MSNPATPSTKAFASHADVQEKKITFTKLSDRAYAYTAEGDPNTGIIVGDDGVLVADTQATPAMARDVIRRIREVTDKPIEYVVLTHYHAVRVLGASAYQPQQIFASQDTYDLIVERGEQDKASEIGRFPRLFRDVESVPAGMTWPTVTFAGKLTLWMGKLVATPRATPSSGCRKTAFCCRAIWSSSTPRRTPATRTSRTGRPPSTTSPN